MKFQGVFGITSLLSFSLNAQNTFPASYNVGIGTTSPQAKLHVNGSQIIENNDSTTSSRTLTLIQSGTNQVQFPAYCGAWRFSIQIQNNNASKELFLAPPDCVNNNSAIFQTINGNMKLKVSRCALVEEGVL